MDNLDNAVQLATIIADSLSSSDVDADRFLSRLYLISDLLHNSTLASATHCYWVFRKYFELLLPAAIDKSCGRLASLQTPEENRSLGSATERVLEVASSY
jgi:hypothetical protein